MVPRRFIFLFLALITASAFFIEYSAAFSPTPIKAIGTFLFKESRFFARALPPERIEELARIAAKPGGTKVIGDDLARLNLPNEVLEDAFARILVYQGHVPKDEAEGWMIRLSGVEGFRSAMRKSMGASPANTIGHLNEVRIADRAALGNFRVRGIGVPFNDPYKKGTTDIDVLLEKNGRLIAIEAKDYPADRAIPMDKFRADMVTLSEFRAANSNSEVLAVFSITNKPVDAGVWKQLQAFADQHSVSLLVGTPADLMYQVPLLLP